MKSPIRQFSFLCIVILSTLANPLDESLKVLRKRANEEPVYYADEKNTGGIPAELKTNTTTTSKSYSDDHGVNDHGKNDNDAGDKDPEPKQKPGSRFLQLTIFSGVSLLLLFVLTFLFRAKDK